jgi:nucleotide-binding universal stress UspA family protein
MFKRILIPTDGSKVADKAVKAGIRFAREIGAKVVGYCAVEPIPSSYYNSEGGIVDGRLIAELDRQAIAAGEKTLAAMAKLARAGRVRFDSLCDKPGTAYEGIVAAARRKKCDVIFMASHGRGGLAKLVMGSVTQKVLAHSKVPVLVYR